MKKLIKTLLALTITFGLVGCVETEYYENKPIDRDELIGHHAYRLVDMLDPDDNIKLSNAAKVVYYGTVGDMTDEAKQSIVTKYNERRTPVKDKNGHTFYHVYHFEVEENEG